VTELATPVGSGAKTAGQLGGVDSRDVSGFGAHVLMT